jgi:D-xylose transport system ATP-binding protein
VHEPVRRRLQECRDLRVTQQETDSGQPLLRLAGVGKNFGAVQALHGIDLDIPAGKVTALLGDNGAGKSTLIKCISGIHSPDHGQMYWQGRQVNLHSPKDAADLGIATVYQDLALCDNLDIVANMFLGRELKVVTVRSIRQPVGSLSGGQRQSVAVARTVLQDARLVILDEPTAALGVTQTQMVLDLITRLAQQNVAVLVISHNLADAMAVADRIAVMYLGTIAAVGPKEQFDNQSIVDLQTTGASTRISGPTDQGAHGDI